MRYSGNLPATTDGHVLPTAADLINNLEEKELINIFRQYSEEQHSHEIVRTIVAAINLLKNLPRNPLTNLRP
jgi:16S rRNA C1402 N4-methylase RsmH